MKIDAVELFHVRLPLKSPFESSGGRVTHHDAVIVRLSAEGVIGWGEAPASSAPTYSSEDVQTAWHMLEDFLVPAALSREISHPSELWERARFVRGNPMAKCALEQAAWDCFAKQQGSSLAKLWKGQRSEIPSGISLGLESTTTDLVDRARRAVAAGYQRVKVKIKPGSDVDVVRAVRRELPDVPLMCDANGTYRLSDAEHLARLDELGLTMIEQPLDVEDLLDHSRLARAIRTPICLDESIHSANDARRAHEIAACRIVNVKQARLGGPTRAIELHDVCTELGLSTWCGGLLETGIGRLHNVALASLAGFTLPGDLSASDRYYDEDLIDPPVTISARGTVAVPTAAGIGHEVLLSRVEKASVRRVTLR